MTNEKKKKLDILRKLTNGAKKHPSQIIPSEVPKAFWSDPEFAGIALRKDSGFIEYVDPAVLADIEFLKVAGMRSSIGLEDVSGRMPITREVALALLPSDKTYPDQFEKIPADLQKDPEIAKYGPQESGNLSRCGKDVLKKSIQAADTQKKVMDIALAVGGDALKICEERSKDDFDVVMAAICSGGGNNGHAAYENASPRLRKDKRIAIAHAIVCPGMTSDTHIKDAWNWPFVEDLPADPDLATIIIFKHDFRTGIFESKKWDADAFATLPESLRSNRDVFFSFAYKAISDWDAKERLKKEIDSKGDAQAVLLSIERQIFDNPFEFLLGAKPEKEDVVLKKMIQDNAAALATLVAWGYAEKDSPVHKTESVPNHLWSDPAFCRAALWLRYDEAYPRVSHALLADSNFFWTVVANRREITAIPDSMKEDLNLARVLVVQCGDQASKLSLFSESVRSNRDFIRSLIISGAEILGGASESIRADRDFVWQSCLRHPESIKYACEKLQGDRAFVKDLMLVIKNNFAERIFENCASSLRDDREVAMLATRRHSYYFRYASESLRGNREIALEAAIGWGNDVLEHASEELKKDIEIQLTGLAVKPSLCFLSKPIATDREIVMDCVIRYADSFSGVCDEIKMDVEFLRRLAGVSNEALARILQHVPDDVRLKLASLKARTANHRGRWVELFVVPVEFGEDSEQDIIRELYLKKGDSILLSSKDMTFVEEEEHGPIGSFPMDSAYDSICLVGDFVFYLSRRGLDSAKDRFVGYGDEKKEKMGLAAAIEDGKSEIYLIDLPVAGIHINLQRIQTNSSESFWNPKILPSSEGLHLILKSNGATMPQGVDFGLDAANLYKAMQEVVRGAPASVYSAFGKMEGEVFVLNGPKQVDACGGAASIHIDGFGQRWLIPGSDGFYTWAEQKKRLESTTHKDDWEIIRGRFLTGASPEERSAVLRHFEKVGDDGLLADVAITLKG